ncbi:O-antigen ligase family protein [Arcobacter sp. FWKO B]|uniref:O-antigen ligase family protein n=1 Tax=Arcobacter sp. FWKO B TaxID=2593672 RepID=UPI0018A6268C|nr:O-antigen ligase family protein [Arcobacter sp. FWKO B]QOG11498.1 O-antigen ligase family protein [Arcobacter sp. FWKO B]
MKQNKFVLALCGFLGLSILSLFWSSDIAFAMDYLRKYWHFLIIPIIITSLERKYIEYIFSAFLVGMFISEVVSYGIFFELWTKDGVSPHDPSPFMDHTNYSAYLAFTTFILIYRVLLADNLKWKIIYSLYLISSFANLFINGGRTGQVIFLVGIIVIGFLHSSNKIKTTFMTFSLSIVLFFSAYYASPTFHDRMNYTLHDLNEMIINDDYTNSFSARVGLWITGVKSSFHEPLLGTGIGDEAVHTKDEVIRLGLADFIIENDKLCYVDYHNGFVQYLVQLGFIGLFLFLLIFYYLFKMDIDQMQYKDLKTVFIFLYLLWTMVGLIFHLNNSMLFFVLFSSVFYVLSNKSSDN